MLMALLCVMGTAFAQQTVSGTVTDANGEPLIGANILEKGTSNGTITDIDGNFELQLQTDEPVLLLSYTGYTTIERPVAEGETELDFTMETSAIALQDIVVPGYISVKRSDLTSGISTVDGEDLALAPIGSIDNLLQGKATGVHVTAQNGQPGGQAYIRIRGTGSINASNEPLFIIDGVQMTSADYNALNPNDIETISVLKDAASTAIYGSRASNGIVQITTKRGKFNSAPKFNYTFQYGQKDAVDDGFDLMDARTKLDYEVAVGARSQESADNIKSQLDQGLIPETNWDDVLLRTGDVMRHDFSLQGGGESASYFASLSTYDEDGISYGSEFGRITGRLNFDYKANDWLKIGNSMTVGRQNLSDLRDRYNVQNPFYARYAYNAYEPLYRYDAEGNLLEDENGDPVYNLTHEGLQIVEAIENNPEELKYTNFIGNFFAEATPLEGLTLNSTIAANYRVYRREYYIFPGSVLDTYVGDPNAPGIKTDNGSDQLIYTWTNRAVYDWSINDQHNFTAMLGTEFTKYDLQQFRIDGKGFPSKQFSTQDNASEITGGNTTRSQWALWSQFGEARYNLNHKYYLSLALRRDGSSRFGSDNLYGTFWAVSGAWNIAEESFIKSNAFDQLKIRASYGTSGNVPTALYWRGVYAFGAYNAQTAAFPSTLDNSDVKWEESKNLTVGLDFGFLRNRFTGSVDYYTRNTVDLLFNEPLSRTVGFSSKLSNVGEVTNSGIEAELLVDVVRSNDFRWSLNGSITTNQNKVDKLTSAGDDIVNASSGVTILREGEEIWTYYLTRYAGVDPSTGNALYLDADGNITSTYSADDAVVLEGKSPIPSYYGAFGTTLEYKGVGLNASFYYVGGNYIYNWQYAVNVSDGDNVTDNQDVEALNYWQNPGDTDVLPRPDVANNINDSDRYLQKGDFIRLRDVSLSYRFPQSLLGNSFIRGVRVFVQGTNLWTYNPYFKGDPEVGRGSEESSLTLLGEFTLFTYPQSKTWTVGATIEF